MKSLLSTAFMTMFAVYAFVHLGWIEADEKAPTAALADEQVVADMVDTVIAPAASFTARVAMAATPQTEGRYTLRAMR